MGEVRNTRGVGRPPERVLRVMFLGAGASAAAGLPQTEQLLSRIWPRAGDLTIGPAWHNVYGAAKWKRELSKAVMTLYPEAAGEGFRPAVGDFFTLLEVMNRVHDERARIALDAGSLLTDLRSEIAVGLQKDLLKARERPSRIPHKRWMEDVARPDVFITSNWDTLAEWAANSAGLNVHFRVPTDAQGRQVVSLPRNSVIILKLHGSVDWGLQGRAVPNLRKTPWNYRNLRDPIPPDARPRRQECELDTDPTSLVRYRSFDNPLAENRVRLGFRDPIMATSAIGKDSLITEQLKTVWDDAYWALSRAKALDIVGYSFPQDDLELRTLLRVCSRKPTSAILDPKIEVSICNPSPEAHARARIVLGEGVRSVFTSAQNWHAKHH